jgi:hypothetical protein
VLGSGGERAERRPGRSRRSLVVGAALAGAVLSGTVACGSRSHVDPDDAAEDVEALLVSAADDVSEDAPLSAAQIEAQGPGDPEVTVVRAHGGELRAEPGYDGTPVLRFPAYEAKSQAPTAILSLRSQDSDWMQPRADQLVFGADLTIDAISDGTDNDNGDNVVQRGLFGAAAQFKLQVDHRRPSCLVHGDMGMVLTKSSVSLDPGSWYRVTCRRTGDEVEIAVSRLDDGSPVDTEVDHARGEIGSVTFPSGTFLSIGGKLGPDGGPVKDATDQYDGRLSRVHVSIEHAPQ